MCTYGIGKFIHFVLYLSLPPSVPFPGFACPFHTYAVHANTLEQRDTPKNIPISPPIHIPEHTSSISIISPYDDLETKTNRFSALSLGHRSILSPISGSLDKGDSLPDISDVKRESLHIVSDKFRSSSITATNELPLTELNLELFTSEKDYDDLHNMSLASSTNELPLSNLRFKHNEETSSCVDVVEKTLLPSRSFSDPNISDMDENTPLREESKKDLSYFPPYDFTRFTDESILKSHKIKTYRLSPMETPIYPNSFYPTELNLKKHLINTPPSRSTSQPAQLYLNANMNSPMRSLSQPDGLPLTDSYNRVPSPSNDVTQSPVPPETVAGAKRHRHSIAGQMSYIKMLGFGFGGPIGLKKITGGSSNSLFSTAVISGSSSAPNLRDMIPNSTSATGIIIFFIKL